MLVEKLTIGTWLIGFVFVGTTIDYIRINRIDKNVVCFYALSGFFTGLIFQFFGVKYGDMFGLISAAVTILLIIISSKQFIVDNIIKTERESLSEEKKVWYEDFKKAVEQEQQILGKSTFPIKKSNKKDRRSKFKY